jgi:hypothetical protein
MAHAVSPSEKSITKGQAGKFADLLVAALVKSDLPSIETQQVLEQQSANLAAQFIALVRGEVDAVSEFIYRTVHVDRTLSPEAAVAATRRIQYVNTNVVASMPAGVGDTVNIIWVPFKKGASNKEVVKKLAEYEMILADPFALLAHNALEPDFAVKQPNLTLWQDADGNWCHATCHDSIAKRIVQVNRDYDDWKEDWWVAAVRKSALSSAAKA